MSKVVSAAIEGDIGYGVGSRGDRVEGAADEAAEIVVRRMRRCWLYAMVLRVYEVRVGVLGFTPSQPLWCISVSYSEQCDWLSIWTGLMKPPCTCV